MVANWQERTDAEDDAGGDPGFGQGRPQVPRPKVADVVSP